MKCISWNLRDLVSELKIKSLRDLRVTEKENLILSQEPKMEAIEMSAIRGRCWNASSLEAIDSTGVSGILATLWEENRFELLSKDHTQNWLLPL